MRNIWLLIILIIVLGGYGLWQKYWEQSRPSFRTTLMSVDTSLVNLVQIQIPSENTNMVLRRLGDQWKMNQDNLNIPVNAQAVNKILSGLDSLATKYMAEADPKRWDVYGLTADRAIEISVYENDEIKESFYLGTNYYNRQSGRSVSYVRIVNQNEVYAIDGDRLRADDLQFQTLFDNRIISVSNDQQIVSLQCELGDTTWHFQKTGGLWMMNNVLPLDAKKVQSFLSNLRSIEGAKLADDFDELKATDQLHHRLRLETDKGNSYSLECFQDSSLSSPFVIHSSQFPDGWWSCDSSQFYGQFYPLNHDFREQVAEMPQ